MRDPMTATRSGDVLRRNAAHLVRYNRGGSRGAMRPAQARPDQERLDEFAL